MFDRVRMTRVSTSSDSSEIDELVVMPGQSVISVSYHESVVSAFGELAAMTGIASIQPIEAAYAETVERSESSVMFELVYWDDTSAIVQIEMI